VRLASEFDLLRVMDAGQDLSQVAVTDRLTHDIGMVSEYILLKDVVHLLQERPLI
jgi:hypothetical protein